MVRPFRWLARIKRNDFIDVVYTAIAHAARLGHAGLSRMQDGRVRRYAAWMTAGSVATLAIVVLA